MHKVSACAYRFFRSDYNYPFDWLSLRHVTAANPLHQYLLPNPTPHPPTPSCLLCVRCSQYWWVQALGKVYSLRRNAHWGGMQPVWYFKFYNLLQRFARHHMNSQLIPRMRIYLVIIECIDREQNWAWLIIYTWIIHIDRLSPTYWDTSLVLQGERGVTIAYRGIVLTMNLTYQYSDISIRYFHGSAIPFGIIVG